MLLWPTNNTWSSLCSAGSFTREGEVRKEDIRPRAHYHLELCDRELRMLIFFGIIVARIRGSVSGPQIHYLCDTSSKCHPRASFTYNNMIRWIIKKIRLSYNNMLYEMYFRKNWFCILVYNAPLCRTLSTGSARETLKIIMQKKETFFFTLIIALMRL